MTKPEPVEGSEGYDTRRTATGIRGAASHRYLVAPSRERAAGYGLKYGGAAETVIAYMVQALRFQVTQMGPKL